ncbi:P-loop containing nucleoside triphosphate hydrolase protein [Massariosphaeria phaeospora]|uniref:P-loop containing nucleoside triphosphate hydrolase protein n=1 Tax=Massariosphaeria phaeospora TaxID=100035 RepID=A0A7C8I2D6_9PLEO|nr:P-loop containing nucleoside triphosphate hydrolase protein [Massariosphaeria phaeospora]
MDQHIINFTGPGNQGMQLGYNSGSVVYNERQRPETPPPPACLVPFRRDPDFVERGTLLDQIRKRCSAPASRVALVGLGGVGHKKSQLAIEYCYRTVEQLPGTWVFWAHASNATRLEQSFREIADYVKIRGREDPKADVFKLVHNWLRIEKNGPWLFVLDNADDAAALSSPPNTSQKSPANHGGDGALQQHLSTYLPPTTHGSVLVTTRTRLAVMQIVEDNDIIPIKPMSDTAAHALFRKKLGDTGDQDDDVAELATSLDFMPLALVQAAAYIRKRAPRCSVQQYIEEYRQNDNRTTSLLNQEAGHLRRDAEANNSVLLTWQITFEYLRSQRPSAADLLSLMSFFDRQGIQEALLHKPSGVANDDEFENDVATLRGYSFVTVTTDANTFEMHNLVQLATRKWLEHQGDHQFDKWSKKFISNLCAEFPEGNYENWGKCQALFPHARAALAQRPKGKNTLKKWAQLLHNAARYASNIGKANEAVYMATVSMEVRREVCGEESLTMLSTMATLVLARQRGGWVKESRSMWRQILTISEKVLRPDQLYRWTSIGSLVDPSDQPGKYQEAELIARIDMAISEQISGSEHPDTLGKMRILAGILTNQLKFEEAEPMYRQMLAMETKMLGPEHPSTLHGMDTLAVLLDKQSKNEEAELMLRETLTRREKVLGSEHTDTLRSMHWLASFLVDQGCYDESLLLFERAYTGHRTVLGEDNPKTLSSMHNLAVVLDKQGKYKEAEPRLRQTLARQEKLFGFEDRDTQDSVAYLANFLARHYRFDECLAQFERAYTALSNDLGEDHPDTRACGEGYAKMKVVVAQYLEEHHGTLSSSSAILDNSSNAAARDVE